MLFDAVPVVPSNRRCIFIVDQLQVIAQSGKLGMSPPPPPTHIQTQHKQKQASVGNDMKEYSLPLIFTFYFNRDTSVPELYPGVFQLKRVLMWSVLTHLLAIETVSTIVVLQ